jgi:hypothetical protein
MAGQLVRGDRLIAGLEALARELRRRSHERWSLPDDEAITLEIARGQPWAGYAQYQGGLRSLIQINDEIPIAAWRMVELVAHEAYPGHHTEHVCKDVALVRGQNRTELSVWVYPTPQALMAEGIAMLARDPSRRGDRGGRRLRRKPGCHQFTVISLLIWPWRGVPTATTKKTSAP